jgi:ankyrin repeat protein
MMLFVDQCHSKEKKRVDLVMLLTVLSTALIACIFLYWFVGGQQKPNRTLAMITAIQQRDKSKVRALASQPKYRDATTEDGDTALHFVARLNAVDMAQILIQAGAKVDIANNHGYTPLMIASERGYKRMVRHLLKAQADLDTTNESGRTAADLAHMKGHREVFYLLDQKMTFNQAMAAS